MDSKGSVLIITYYWPPAGGGGVQRWLKFSKYLARLGWKPIVIAPENPEYPSHDDSLVEDIHPDVEVIKTPIWEPYSLYKKLLGKGSDEKINTGIIQKSHQQSKLEKLSIWLRGNLLIPDPRVFWVRPTASFLKRIIEERKPDCIITTGPPHSVHLIGLKLKKELGINWIADFRDPWSNIDYLELFKQSSFAKSKQKRLENNVLKTADSVISVSGNWKKELLAFGARRVEVITNGFDRDDFKNISPVRKDKFVLTYTGLITGFRNPSFLWQILEELCKEEQAFYKSFELRLMGNIAPEVIEELKLYPKLGKVTNYLGYVSHHEVLQQYAESSMLLLLLNQSKNASGHIPGKFFEYLAAKRPVLAIGDTGGDVAEILSESNSGLIFQAQSDQAIKQYVLDLFNNKLNFEFRNIDQFSRESTAKQLEQLIKNIKA